MNILNLFYFIPGTLPFSSNFEYDKQTNQVMRKLLSNWSNCIDIGSHRGAILHNILKCAPNGTHYAFEPLPKFHRILKKTFPNNCRIHNVALSDKKGLSTFNHVVSNPPYSGFLQRKYPFKEATELILVDTNRLDNVLPTGQKVDFIKIDVEGAELKVLKGALNTILKNRPVIVFEHGLGAANYYGTTPDMVYDFLTQKCQLKVSLMKRWLKDQMPFSREEFMQQFYKKRNYFFIAYP